jgi:hypothetical protein
LKEAAAIAGSAAAAAGFRVISSRDSKHYNALRTVSDMLACSWR